MGIIKKKTETQNKYDTNGYSSLLPSGNGAPGQISSSPSIAPASITGSNPNFEVENSNGSSGEAAQQISIRCFKRFVDEDFSPMLFSWGNSDAAVESWLYYKYYNTFRTIDEISELIGSNTGVPTVDDTNRKIYYDKTLGQIIFEYDTNDNNELRELSKKSPFEVCYEKFSDFFAFLSPMILQVGRTSEKSPYPALTDILMFPDFGLIMDKNGNWQNYPCFYETPFAHQPWPANVLFRKKKMPQGSYKSFPFSLTVNPTSADASQILEKYLNAYGLFDQNNWLGHDGAYCTINRFGFMDYCYPQRVGIKRSTESSDEYPVYQICRPSDSQ